MKLLKNINLFLFLLVWTTNCLAQSGLKFANIGDFTSTEGNIIKDCKIGYRTIGKLNADKSNAVLWSTCFTGTTEQIINLGFTSSLIDSSGLYIILVDALTNGVSSSPSNMEEFPTISIRDMVNSQHELLVNHLGINHLYAVMGISMGGMQTFEWTIAYPDFMDKAIPIVGSPKASSQDKLIFQTMADLMLEAGQNKQKLDFAYKRAHNIMLINIYTPTYMVSNTSVDSLDNYLINEYDNLMKPEDYLGGSKAIISNDIFKSSHSKTDDDIKNIIKAELLIISATQDHLVNPIAAIELSKTLNCKLVTLLSDCGHMSFACEAEKIKKAITTFLKE